MNLVDDGAAQQHPGTAGLDGFQKRELAGGGDQLTFLKTIKPRSTGVLLRSAIVDQIQAMTAAGLPIQAQVDGRVRVN